MTALNTWRTESTADCNSWTRPFNASNPLIMRALSATRRDASHALPTSDATSSATRTRRIHHFLVLLLAVQKSCDGARRSARGAVVRPSVAGGEPLEPL